MPSDESKKLLKSLIGPSGEYFVLYRLNSLGMLASLAPQNAPTADILVLNTDETVMASVQVKSRTKGSDRGWHMKEKHEHTIHPRLFYAFVDLEGAVVQETPRHPQTYVVPSEVVAEVCTVSHRVWLETPGRGGQKRKDGPMRRVLPSYEKFGANVPGYPPGWLEQYSERWDLLKEVL